jgi:hypothetical protein
MAIDREQRRVLGASTAPDRVEPLSIREELVVEAGLRRVERRITVPVAVAEGLRQMRVAPDLVRQPEVLRLREQELGMLEGRVRGGIQEEQPEMVVDDVERDLTLADRAADEGPDHVLRMVEQERITRPRRDLGVDDEGIRAERLVVGHRMGLFEPVGLDEERPVARERVVAEADDHVGLVDDRRMDLPEAVVDGRRARIVVGAHGRDDLDRSTRRRLRADELEEVVAVRLREADVGQEEMLVEVAGREGVLRVGAVQEGLPLRDLARFRRGRRLEGALLGRARAGRTAGQPGRERRVVGRLEGREAEGHAALGMAPEELSQLGLVGGTRQVRGLGVIFAGLLRHEPLRLEQVEHQRVVRGRGRVALEDVVEAERPPARFGLSVEEEARRSLRADPRGSVDRLLASAALRPLEGIELQLAGGVVAGVADDAAAIEDRLHVLQERHGPRDGLDRDRRQGRRHARRSHRADGQTEHEDPQHRVLPGRRPSAPTLRPVQRD